jgi:hypothetical protein
MSDFRCPHCRTLLPRQAERGSFCSACGRRIEGWTAAPKEATPTPGAHGETPLPDGEQPTRQMDVTPSLLRAVALSKGAGKRAQPAKRGRSSVGLALGMILVAAAGGTAGFLLVHAHKRRAALERARLARATAPLEEPSVDEPSAGEPLADEAGPGPARSGAPARAPVAAKDAPPPAVAAPPRSSAPVAAPKTTAPAGKASRPQTATLRAHRIAAAPVAVAAAPTPPPRHQKVAPGGLPHKAVATDSQSMAQQEKREAAAEQAQKQQLALPTAARETAEAPPPSPAAAEAADKQSAEAALDADSIRLVVRQHLPQVRACYNRAFKDSSPGGTVEIGLAIDGNGRAQNVRAETNTTDSPDLARCLEQRVREWQFPRPVGGDYELIYPFVFAPGS